MYKKNNNKLSLFFVVNLSEIYIFPSLNIKRSRFFLIWNGQISSIDDFKDFKNSNVVKVVYDGMFAFTYGDLKINVDA